MLLKDKVVVVSGIGPGLGVKLAIEAAREGAKVVVVAARSADKLDDAEQRIRALGTHTAVLKQTCDITQREQCDALAAAAAREFGRIDALVNSAFVHGDMDYASTADLDSWRATLDTNLLGTLRLTQACIPHLPRGSAVVMINTMAARKIPPLGEAGYAASKAALANSVKWLAKELGPKGIRVNSVHMGWMWGAPVEGYVNWQAQESKVPVETLKAQIAADIPLGHIPTDDDCAKAALFMVSDYAAAVTGAALDANGGAYMP
ncbi:SDR family oxidoreductase [Solimonas marina]|uniref:SDR family oxidoreductase n=1 Tax=Solimonas marina TaxID=2714601 RepID=A0A969W5B9_9GAMM|nr:SDR family oxidoreductase [Solimonas marina]NKF20867.1 SDR family oxidoreductase [Solimonas marina]